MSKSIGVYTLVGCMSVGVYTPHIPIFQNIQYSIFIFDIRFEKVSYNRPTFSI